MKIIENVEIKIKKPEAKIKENLHTEEKLFQELPESLIPGQKGFNEKRQEDIKNIENDKKRKRATEETKVPTIVKKSMKMVKKLFNK
jgi:hypothetical protein